MMRPDRRGSRFASLRREVLAARTEFVQRVRPPPRSSKSRVFSQQQGLEREAYRPQAIEVLKSPELKAQVQAGIESLPPRSRGAFSGILTALES